VEDSTPERVRTYVEAIQAMNNIGVMYKKGEGVQKDLHEANKWFQKAIASRKD
jgi:TPR repeat protein